MAWSTRELALLAGTTLRTVRHYHEIGVLSEPERFSNGYKIYRTEHLVRLLEIRRLTRLGLPLAAVTTVLQKSADLDAALNEADAQLEATIVQLQVARREIAAMRSTPVETDLPFDAAVAATSVELSRADRSIYAVLTQIFGEQGQRHFTSILQGFTRSSADEAFDALASDADDETRGRVAEDLLPHMQHLLSENPLPADALASTAQERSTLGNAVIDVMLEVYNPAQLDVIARVMRATGLV